MTQRETSDEALSSIRRGNPVLKLLATAVLLCLAFATALNRMGRLPLGEAGMTLTGIQAEAGFAYIAATGRRELSSHERPSSGKIFEDGRPLAGPGNALHDDIRRLGQGRFSFWHEFVYFSTSDGTDPRTNGRQYHIRYPRLISQSLAWTIYLVAGLACAGSVSRLIIGTLRSSKKSVGGLYLSGNGWEVPGGRRLWVSGFALLAGIALLNVLWLSKVNTWVLVTAPLEGPVAGASLEAAHDINTIIGYSWLADGDVLHIENVSPLRQSLSFNGHLYYPDGYFLRPFYPFLVSTLSWFLGLKSAALAVNYFAFVGLVLATGWLGFSLAGRQAAVIAGALAATSLGVFVHLNDLSAHLLGNAFGAVALAAIHASRVWCTSRPAVIHWRLGLLLMVVSLVYPSGAVLTMAYVMTAVWYSRWFHVVGAAALALSARPLWEWLMTDSYIRYFGVAPAYVKVADFSSHALLSATVWLERLQQGIPTAVTRAIPPLLDCLFVSSPLTIVLGLGAVAVLGWRAPRLLWFFAVFILLPVAGAIFFSPAALARGYIVGGAAVVLFAALAAAAVGVRSSYRRIALVACSVVIVLQLLWSGAYLFGYYFPVKAFLIGYLHAPHAAVRPEVFNLTGAFPLWQLYGGPADFVAAGGLPLGSTATNTIPVKSFWFAAVLNGFLLLPLIALVATFVRVKGRIAGSKRALEEAGVSISRIAAGIFWGFVWLGLTGALSGAGYAWQRRGLEPFVTGEVTHFAGVQDYRREIDLSPQVLTTLRATLLANPGAEVQAVLHGRGFRNGRFSLGSTDLPAVFQEEAAFNGRFLWRLNRVALLSGIESGAATLKFAGQLEDGALSGWQRGGVAGQRTTPVTLASGIPYLPSFELRVYDRTRRSMIWLGY